MVTQFIMLYTLLVNHYCCHPVWSYWQKQAKRCRKSQKIWKARKDWGGKIADVSFKNVGNGKMSLMSQANMNDHNRTQHTIPWYFIEYVDNGIFDRTWQDTVWLLFITWNLTQLYTQQVHFCKLVVFALVNFWGHLRIKILYPALFL